MPFTGTVDVNSGAASHSGSAGPHSSNRMSPVGPNPPRRWATSKMVPPTAIAADALVVITVWALLTVTISAGSLQAVVTASLLASPL